MKSRDAVVTGIGLVGPTGSGHVRFWEMILQGQSAIRPIQRFDASSFGCRVAGEVPEAVLLELVESRKQRMAPRVSQLALAATHLALDDAGLDPDRIDSTALSVVIGTALAGWSDGEIQTAILLERGARRVNPFVTSGSGSHGPGAEIAAASRARGPQFTFAAGCPASLQAISHAAALVEMGSIDVCLSGGTEAPLSPLAFAALCRTNELSALNEPSSSASRPFDASHAGMVLSEGSCLLVIEAREHAERRGASIYATITGGGGSCDAEGLHGLDTTGATGAAALARLLKRANLAPQEVDYICAHANSSPAFDRKEIAVLRRALGQALDSVPLSSIKGVMGHPFGASGAFQVAAACLAIRDGCIPPTANLQEPANDCAARHVLGRSLNQRVCRALVTSYGYGGVNAYLLLAGPSADDQSKRVD
jgi:3-oxoacyl-[acyl-carrier-protein] synthase II